MTAQAVRFGQWKALRTAPNEAIELYDLNADPSETTDLAALRPDMVETAATYMSDAYAPASAWPLQERTLRTRIIEVKNEVGAWARQGQSQGRWWGMLADIWDAL